MYLIWNNGYKWRRSDARLHIECSTFREARLTFHKVCRRTYGDIVLSDEESGEVLRIKGRGGSYHNHPNDYVSEQYEYLKYLDKRGELNENSN